MWQSIVQDKHRRKSTGGCLISATTADGENRGEQVQTSPRNMGSSSSGAGGGGSVARSTSLSPPEKGEKCFNTTTRALMLSQPLPHPCTHAYISLRVHELHGLQHAQQASPLPRACLRLDDTE